MQVLHDLGVDTLEGRAAKNPGELAADFNERVEAMGHETLKAVEETEATRWVEAARAYAGTQKAPAADKQTE